MPSEVALQMLAFLGNSVESGLETIQEARRFVRRIEGLREEDRCFLECALRDKADMEDFHAALIAGKLRVDSPA